jgi:O-antigen/teichoic acid export membrane protein
MLQPGSGYLSGIRDIVLFIPIGVLFVSVSALLIQLNVRAGRFRRLAAVTVAQVGFTVAIQVALGVLHVEHALIIGSIAGTVLSGALLAWFLLREGGFKDMRRAMTLHRLRTTARQFVNFPRYTLAADALNVLVQQFTPVFIMALFNPALAGLYSFSIRVVRVPMLVVSTAIGTVLRKEGVDHLDREGNLRALYAPIVRGLFLLGLVPFVIILIFGRQLFSVVFGSKWAEAGQLVQILSPGILLEFVALPLATFFLITNSQRYTFRLQLAGFVCLIAALLAGKTYLHSFMATCVLVSVVMVVVNLASIVLAARVSKDHAVVPASPLPMVSAL